MRIKRGDWLKIIKRRPTVYNDFKTMMQKEFTDEYRENQEAERQAEIMKIIGDKKYGS